MKRKRSKIRYRDIHFVLVLLKAGEHMISGGQRRKEEALQPLNKDELSVHKIV